MNFRDKTVIITGGSKGVGAACAMAFAKQGANLVIAARGRRELDLIAVKLRTMTSVAVVPMDIADLDACENLLKKAQFEFGAIHILVNNAGYHARGPFETVDAREMAKMIDINLKAPVILSRLALPYLRDAGEGVIVNVASLAGMFGVPNSAVYSATKAGLRALTFAMYEELRGTGIKVAAVSPGPDRYGLHHVRCRCRFGHYLFSATEYGRRGRGGDSRRFARMTSGRGRCRRLSGFLATFSNLFPSCGPAASTGDGRERAGE